MNLQERKLRKLIRKGIQVVFERKEQQYAEEQRLRRIIQHLIQEAKGLAKVADKVIHRNTGINDLDSLFKRIITQIGDAYTNLSSSEIQRKSFRYHFLINWKNSLQPVNVNRFAPGTQSLNEQEEEGPDFEIAIDDPDITDPPDASKYIPSRPEDIAAEKETKEAEAKEEEKTFIKLESDDPNVLQGATKAEEAWNKVETQIITAYEDLIVPEDAEAFYDYGLTNLKLYFDTFESEMSTPPGAEEPPSPDYPPAS